MENHQRDADIIRMPESWHELKEAETEPIESDITMEEHVKNKSSYKDWLEIINKAQA